MILVFTDIPSPRIEYTLKLIFHDILGSEVRITSDREEYLQSNLPGICYATAPLNRGLYMGAHPLLTTTTRVMPPLEPVSWKGETGFFPASEDSFMPFDPFASSFLTVTRLEEYAPGPRDQHGRFRATDSFLHRYDLLEKAVVNRWARMVADALEENHGTPLFPPPASCCLTTIDIDNAWAFRHKGFLRTAGALLKKIFTGKWKDALRHFLVVCCKKEDPYDTYAYISSLYSEKKNGLKFFFLLGDRAPYDKQVSWQHQKLWKLVRETADAFPVGIHPSYAAGKEAGTTRTLTEKQRLEKILGRQISDSRQHYLLLEFPGTYRKLLDADITTDYTMGYSDRPGFRAGTATPFLFYDLEKEETTPLRIFPFQVMDGTLRQYLKMTPRDAITKITALRDEVRTTGGIFCTIWHNESLNDQGYWRGYRVVFERLNREGSGHAQG